MNIQANTLEDLLQQVIATTELEDLQEVQLINGSISLTVENASPLGFRLVLTPTDGPPMISLGDIVNFISPSLGALLPPNVPLFDTAVPIPITMIAVAYDNGTEPAIFFSVSSHLEADWDIIPNNLVINGITLNFQAQYWQGGEMSTFGGNIGGQLTIEGQELDIIIYLTDPSNFNLEILLPDSNVLPGLDSIVGFVGGDSLRQTVQNGLDSLGLEEVGIDSIRIGFDIPNQRFTQILMGSHITIASTRIDLLTQLPDFEFGGSLAEDSVISIRALVDHFFGTGEAFPEITISRLGFAANPDEGNYNIQVSIESDWSLRVGNGTLSLTNFELALNKAGTEISGEISSTITIGGVDITLMARREGAGGDWQFSGSTGRDEQIPIGDALSDLGIQFSVGLTPPAAIETLCIEQPGSYL